MAGRLAARSIVRKGKMIAGHFAAGLRHHLPRFTADRRGNVAMIFALCSIPILFAVGAAIDYTSASRRKAKLDAIADAVALSTVTLSGNPPAYSPIPGEGLDSQDAQTRAQQMFNSLAASVLGVQDFNGTVTVTDGTASSQPPRTTTVKYTAQSINAFGGIIGMNTIAIGNGSGGTVAQVSIAPNINFYIMADSSPSMAIPATSDGITAMYQTTYCAYALAVANANAQYTGSTTPATVSGCPTTGTPSYQAGPLVYDSNSNDSTYEEMIGNEGDNEGGCSFACHETDQSKWVLPGNSSYPGTGTAKSPGYVDDYTYAENIAGLTLRIDNLRSAIQQLGPYATNMSQGSGSQTGNGATYKMSVATFDTDWTTSPCTNAVPAAPLHFISGGSSLTPQDMNTASTAAANIQMLQMFNNGGLSGSNSTSTSKVPVKTLNKKGKPTTTQTSITQINSSTSCSNNDGSTALDAAMKQINTLMPTPGNGTNLSGDTPQEVLMLITDGVNDVQVNGGSRTISMINTANCTAIKQRASAAGLPIQIAVLYLNYTPLPSNSFYVGNVQPFDNNTSPTPNPNIATALQSCASSPSLFTEVTTDQDISAALQALFTAAANQAARLTQ